MIGRFMGLGRKNRQAMQRTPHPDSRMEAELQKILMLRRMADGYEEQICHYMDVVDDAQDVINTVILAHSRNSMSFVHVSAKQLQQVTEASERQASRAEERMSALRGEMLRVHEEIAELIAKLPDTDLAFLEPAPS